MGKHDIDRVCQGLRDSLKALCVICLVLAVAVFASRRLLLSIFLDPLPALHKGRIFSV